MEREREREGGRFKTTVPPILLLLLLLRTRNPVPSLTQPPPSSSAQAQNPIFTVVLGRLDPFATVRDYLNVTDHRLTDGVD
jgi:hypothetical protein